MSDDQEPARGQLLMNRILDVLQDAPEGIGVETMVGVLINCLVNVVMANDFDRDAFAAKSPEIITAMWNDLSAQTQKRLTTLRENTPPSPLVVLDGSSAIRGTKH